MYPDTVLGVLAVTNIYNKGTSPEIASFLKEEEERIKNKFLNVQISEVPEIVCWREAYRRFGAKPSDYPSSIENLIRRVVKDNEVHHINNLVDLYNFISLKYLVPAGGEDLNKVEGDIHLTLALENEQLVKMLGESEPRAPHKGEVIYKDDKGAICRRWNWKEAERTKLTEETNKAVFVIEGLPPVNKEVISNVAEELALLIRKYCKAIVEVKILDKNLPEFILL